MTLREKVQLLRNSEGKSHRTLASEFHVSKTQVTGILKRKAELMEAYETDSNPDRKRQFQNSAFTEIDNIVFEWFSRMRSLNIPVSGPMIQAKALDVAKALNQPDFKASPGWLFRFKNRHVIGGNKISGEKCTVSQETIGQRHERLPTVLQGYTPEDIFNMAETAVLPDKTLATKGRDISGGKKSKERLTVALFVNQLGAFEKPLVIGKSLRPRCFKRSTRGQDESPEEYKAVEDSCPAHDTLDDGWERRLIQEATDGPTEPEEPAPTEDEDEDDQQLTDGQVLDMLNTARKHCLQKNYSKTLECVMAAHQQLQVEKLSKRTLTLQPTLDSFVKRL